MGCPTSFPPYNTRDNMSSPPITIVIMRMCVCVLGNEILPWLAAGPTGKGGGAMDFFFLPGISGPGDCVALLGRDVDLRMLHICMISRSLDVFM